MDMQDKIEKYILNQLTPSEKADFEIEMYQNPQLKDQVELEQAIVNQIRVRAFVDKQINQAKEELDKEKIGESTPEQIIEVEEGVLHSIVPGSEFQRERKLAIKSNLVFKDQQIAEPDKEKQERKTIRIVIYSVVSIAAVMALFFIVRGVWQGRQYDQLYATNFNAYTNDYLTTDGTYRGDAEIDSMQVSAMMAYEKKDFATAVIHFARILSSTDNPEIRFYLAVSQLETGQIKEAQTNLHTLYLQPGEYRYYEQIRWYLALLHLKLHHKTEVKKYLNELIILEGKYWDKAKEVQKEL